MADINADHFINLQDSGLVIDIKNDDDGCNTNMGSDGNITTTATEKIINSVNDKTNISIEEDQIILATKNASIIIKNDKIVLNIGSSSIVLDNSSVSIEATTVNIKSTANMNIESTANALIKANAIMNIEGSVANVSGKVTASLKGNAATMLG